MSGFPTSFNQQSYQQTFGRLTTAASIKADKGMAAIKTAASSARQKIAQQPRNIWIASIATATFAAAGVAAYLARNQISNLVWPIPPQPINLQNTGTALNISTTENSTLADCDFSPLPLNNLTEIQSFQTPLTFPQVTVTLPKIAEVIVETVEEKETPEVSQVEVSIETVKKEEVSIETTEQEEASNTEVKEEVSNKATEQEEASNKAAEQEEVSNKAAEQEEASNKAAEQEEASNKAAEQEEASNKAAEQEEASNKAAEEEEASNKATAQEEVSKEEEVKPSESDVDSDETKEEDSSTKFNTLYTTMVQNATPYGFGGAVVAGAFVVLGAAWYVSKCCSSRFCKICPSRPKERLIDAREIATKTDAAVIKLGKKLEILKNPSTRKKWKELHKRLTKREGVAQRCNVIRAIANNDFAKITEQEVLDQALALASEAVEYKADNWKPQKGFSLKERELALKNLNKWALDKYKTNATLTSTYWDIQGALKIAHGVYEESPENRVKVRLESGEKKDGPGTAVAAPPADNADPAAAGGAAAGAPPAAPVAPPAPPAPPAVTAVTDAADAAAAAEKARVQPKANNLCLLM